jgi:hypothetical protein
MDVFIMIFLLGIFFVLKVQAAHLCSGTASQARIHSVFPEDLEREARSRKLQESQPGNAAKPTQSGLIGA